MDGDVDLEEAHRFREEGIPCVSPLVYLWDPGEDGSPGEQPASKIANFQISSNVIILATPHRITTA
jgi:hypothetical protein